MAGSQEHSPSLKTSCTYEYTGVRTVLIGLDAVPVLLEDEEKFSNLMDQLEQFFGELAVANTFFNECPNGHGRVGGIGALGAVCEFVNSFDNYRAANLVKPFQAVQTALIDAENGSPHPMTTPKKLNRRPPNNMDKTSLKIHSSVALELLFKSCGRLDEAAEEVATSLRKSGYKLSKGDHRENITSTTVKNWRFEVNSGPSSSGSERERYQYMIDHLPEDCPEAAAVARNLLRSLPKNIRPGRNLEKGVT